MLNGSLRHLSQTCWSIPRCPLGHSASVTPHQDMVPIPDSGSIYLKKMMMSPLIILFSGQTSWVPSTISQINVSRHLQTLAIQNVLRMSLTCRYLQPMQVSFLLTAQKEMLRSECKCETGVTNCTLAVYSCLNKVEKSIQFLAFLREVLPNKIQDDEC